MPKRTQAQKDAYKAKWSVQNPKYPTYSNAEMDKAIRDKHLTQSQRDTLPQRLLQIIIYNNRKNDRTYTNW